MTDVIRVTRNQGVAFVTLQRPERNNALNRALIDALHGAFVTLAADRSIASVVLCGEGKSLCAGADIAWMREGASYSLKDNVEDLMHLGHMLRALDEMPQTTIARVNGPIYGGGVGLVAACDIALGSATATFCLSEVKLGIVPGMISPFVQRAVGERMARRYFQSAEIFDAQEARRLGLLHEVIAPEHLDSAIDRMLMQLTSAAPQARRLAKQAITETAGKPIDEALLSDIATMIADLRARPEAHEGLSAFLEKRKPYWALSYTNGFSAK
ncbi:enoyl-CoA hydratase-related protein [Paraburkholderia jirisanensis]